MEPIETTVEEVLGNEGIVKARRVRSTGVIVGLYDNKRTTQFDPDGGRWVTLCEAHSNLVNHDTRRLAERFMSCPEEWCENCAAILDAANKPIEVEVQRADDLIFIHQNRTAIVLSPDQAGRLADRLLEFTS